jgi:hypothetical protein
MKQGPNARVGGAIVLDLALVAMLGGAIAGGLKQSNFLRAALRK